MTESNSKAPLFKRLAKRRFFPIFGSYLLGAWAVVQFVDWIATRYQLSPVWSEGFLVFFIVLIPAAILVIYEHGLPGDQDWSKLEKTVIPVNVLLALVLVFFRVNSLPAPQAAAIVKATNEDGKQVSRLVPQASSTRRVVIFPFKNNTNDEEMDWMRIAFSKLLDFDLEQDSRLISINGLSLWPNYQNYGHRFEEDLPFAIQRNIANDQYSDIFIQGAYAKNGEMWKVDVKAYTSRDGKVFYNNVFENKDFYALVDRVTEDFKNKLHLADISTSKVMVDLPADGLISPNVDALKYYTKSSVENIIGNDPAKAITTINKAIASDPNCTECHFSLAWFLSRSSRPEEAKNAIKKAMDKIDHLPERQQLAIKDQYYRAIDDYDKAIALNEMWRKFYPNDYKPYSKLMQYYLIRSDLEKATEIGQEAIKVGHTGNILLKMAELELYKDNTKEATTYLETFQQQFPGRLKETSQLADIYAQQGDFDKANNHLEKLQLLEPGNTNLLIKLADLQTRTGQFTKANQFLKEALQVSKSARDSVQIFLKQEELLRSKGQANEAIALMKERIKVQRSFMTEIECRYEYMNYPTMLNFKEADKQEEIKKECSFFMNHPDPQFHLISCATKINYYLAFEEIEKYEAVDKHCRAEIVQRQGSTIYFMIDAFVYEMKGDYDKAIRSMDKTLSESKIKAVFLESILVRMYRKDGQLDKAKTYLQTLLEKQPVDGKLFVEMAAIEKDMGNNDAAKEWLDKAFEVWKEADQTYLPLIEARKLMASINS